MIFKYFNLLNFFNIISEAREMERKFYKDRPDLRHLYKGY